MASLTPLSKGLIALAVVGAMASAVWHLGLKDRLGGATPPAQSQPADASVAAPPATPAPAPDTDPNTSPSASTGTPANAPDQAAPLPSLPATPAPEPKAQASGLSPAENAETGRRLLESKNYEQARVHLEQAVQGGDGGAACHLGEMHLKGQGGPVNREKAASLFQFAQSRSIICFTSGQ